MHWENVKVFKKSNKTHRMVEGEMMMMVNYDNAT